MTGIAVIRASGARPTGVTSWCVRLGLVVTIGMAVMLAGASLAPSGAIGQSGAPVVDHTFTDPGDPTGGSGLLPASGLINECCNFVGQTFTAGRDGVLTGINLHLYEPNGDPAVPAAPVRVSIRNTNGDRPGQTVFTTTVLNSQVAPLSQLIVFPQLLQIQAGTKYAIVVNLENPSPLDRGGWTGASGVGGYPGGDACSSSDDGVNWSCYTGSPGPTMDGHFTTCVSPSPASDDVGPSATADSVSVAKGSRPTAIDVLGNDGNADGGPMALIANSDAAHGTVEITRCGADVTYTPDADYSGPDSFTYTLNGGSTATVSITVTDPAVTTPPPSPGVAEYTRTLSLSYAAKKGKFNGKLA